MFDLKNRNELQKAYLPGISILWMMFNLLGKGSESTQSPVLNRMTVDITQDGKVVYILKDIIIFDLKSEKELFKIPISTSPMHTEPLFNSFLPFCSAAISKDNKYVFSFFSDCSIKVFNLEQRREIYELKQACQRNFTRFQ